MSKVQSFAPGGNFLCHEAQPRVGGTHSSPRLPSRQVVNFTHGQPEEGSSLAVVQLIQRRSRLKGSQCPVQPPADLNDEAWV